MIFVADIANKIDKGRKYYGYTVEDTGALLDVNALTLTSIMNKKQVYPDTQATLKQTITRDFDIKKGFAKYPVAEDYARVRQAIYVLKDDIKKLLEYEFNPYDVAFSLFESFVDLYLANPNKAVVAVLKSEAVFRSIIDTHSLTYPFLNNADRQLKCDGYVKELKAKALLHQNKFFPVAKPDNLLKEGRNGLHRGESPCIKNFSGIGFRPSQVLSIKL